MRMAVLNYILIHEFQKARSAAEHIRELEGYKLHGNSYIAAVECSRYLEEGLYEKSLDYAKEAYEINSEEYLTGYLLAKCLYYTNVKDPRLLSLINECKEKEATDEIKILELDYLFKIREFDTLKKLVRKYNMLNPNSKVSIYGTQRVSRINKEANEAEELSTGIDEQGLTEAMEKLNSLIGLGSVKEEIEKYKKTIIFETIRKQKLGLLSEEKQRYNFIFSGNPGTGKTTVARLFGSIFKALGILKEGHLVEVDRAGLVGEYIGQTAIKTKKAITDAMGGVLFVDEAYSLAGRGENDFGREALETILKAAEDFRGEIVIILAGYKYEMSRLMEMNPGLQSRFNKFLYFEDYSEAELLQIAKRLLDKEGYYFTSSGEKAFLQVIAKHMVDEKFGNAREVELIIRAAIEKKALDLNLEDPDNLEDSILRRITAKEFGVDLEESAESKIENSYRKLNEMIGLDSVKKNITGLLSLVEYQKAENDRGIKNSMPSLHMVFMGNPGTGKTSVALIISEILRDMGILKKGHLVVASRQDLVAEYVGQTAQKTASKIKEAYGGVLFIDEAYSLVSSSENDFGNEVVAVLIKEMEDNRDKLVVILAGYTDEINELLDTNPGFKSRINNYIVFNDYTPSELFEIFQLYCRKELFTISSEAEHYLKELLQKQYDNRDKNYGNAREIRKLFETMKINLAYRVQSQQIQGDARRCFIMEDLH